VSYLKALNIQKFYGSRKILSNLSFTVEKGEVVIIEGPSGAGKTTLLNIISGIDLPDGGRVLLDGMNITRMSEDERARVRLKKIGIIFQSSALIEDLNVMENIALPLKLAGRKWKERVFDLLKYFGIEHLKYSYPESLSGGEKQRVEIARALANEPEILIADEPTSNLDDDNARNLVALLRKINRETGTSIIIATHDVRLKNLEGKRYLLKEGRLYER